MSNSTGFILELRPTAQNKHRHALSFSTHRGSSCFIEMDHFKQFPIEPEEDLDFIISFYKKYEQLGLFFHPIVEAEIVVNEVSSEVSASDTPDSPAQSEVAEADTEFEDETPSKPQQSEDQVESEDSPKTSQTKRRSKKISL